MKSKWVYVGVAGALGVLGLVWWQSQKSAAPQGPQNAVDPNAQIGAIQPMGTAPDIGNLLSYNQVPGAISAPQVTSVDPFAGNYYNLGWQNIQAPGNIHPTTVGGVDPSNPRTWIFG